MGRVTAEITYSEN